MNSAFVKSTLVLKLPLLLQTFVMNWCFYVTTMILMIAQFSPRSQQRWWLLHNCTSRKYCLYIELNYASVGNNSLVHFFRNLEEKVEPGQ